MPIYLPIRWMSVAIGLVALAQNLVSACDDLGARGPFHDDGPFVVVLGIAQDGGFPQAGCRKTCCRRAWDDPTLARFVVGLAIVDPSSGNRWLIECTPDFKQQLHLLDQIAPPKSGLGISGVFLTHAHIGHYSGLIHLGREVLGAQQVPVFAMPRMSQFLRTQGPWSQLVELKNIDVQVLAADQPIELNSEISVTPILAPHRDEFSETVAFRIQGKHRSVLFLPDIDKWERWEHKIEQVIEQVDVAYLDGTFFDGQEIPGRDMREIPHPFVSESIIRFAGLTPEVRGKIRFIHLNHTNPLLDAASLSTRQVLGSGMQIASQGERVDL